MHAAAFLHALRAEACLDGVREGHCHLAQADIREQIAQRVHRRQGEDAENLHMQLSIHSIITAAMDKCTR